MTCTTCGTAAPHLASSALCPSCQLRAHHDPNRTVMWLPPSVGAALPRTASATRARRGSVVVTALGGLSLAASPVTHLVALSWLKPLLFIGGGAVFLAGLIGLAVLSSRNKNTP